MGSAQRNGLISGLVGVSASLSVHTALWLALATVKPFSFEFDLQLPAEVEFGLTEEMEGAEAAGAVEAVAEPGAKGLAATQPIALDAGVPDPAPKPKPKPKPSPQPKPQPEPEAEPEAESAAEPSAPSALVGPSRIPAGAQLALRIDMARVRQSVLAEDVKRFLAAVPDWQLLLDDSGIDPVADLDRLLIASPNLQRSKLVLAGRHNRETRFPKDSVAAMARARGKTASWSKRAGVPTARWYNRDVTARVLALLGDKHFAIVRPTDVEKVLALTQARAERDAETEGLEPAKGAAVLLSMGPHEAVSFEVEGARNFARGQVRYVPLRLRGAVREEGPDAADLSILATYENAQSAQDATAYWQRVRDHYAGQPMLSLMGIGAPLRHMKIESEGTRVRIQTRLNAAQLRMILAYFEGLLMERRPIPAVPNRPAPSTTHDQPTKKGP